MIIDIHEYKYKYHGWRTGDKMISTSRVFWSQFFHCSVLFYGTKTTLEILMVSVILITSSSMRSLCIYVHIRIYHALTLAWHTHHNHTHKSLAVYIYMCVYTYITQ